MGMLRKTRALKFKVGQAVSEPNKGKKRKNDKKKKDVGSKRPKQSAAARNVKATLISEEKDNNDST